MTSVVKSLFLTIGVLCSHVVGADVLRNASVPVLEATAVHHMSRQYHRGHLQILAKARLFPVCFYNETRPNKEEYASYYLPGLTNALKVAAGLHMTSGISASPDGKWIVANLTESQNKRVSAVWPRVGCIGDASNSVRTSAERLCVRYIEDLTAKGNYFGFGIAQIGGNSVSGEFSVNNEILHCRSVSTTSDP